MKNPPYRSEWPINETDRRRPIEIVRDALGPHRARFGRPIVQVGDAIELPLNVAPISVAVLLRPLPGRLLIQGYCMNDHFRRMARRLPGRDGERCLLMPWGALSPFWHLWKASLACEVCGAIDPSQAEGGTWMCAACIKLDAW